MIPQIVGDPIPELPQHGRPRAGCKSALDRLAAVAPEHVPACYPGWHAVVGELHSRLGQQAAAVRAWEEALRLATATADQSSCVAVSPTAVVPTGLRRLRSPERVTTRSPSLQELQTPSFIFAGRECRGQQLLLPEKMTVPVEV